MDNERRFEITNKIITVNQIKEIADYLIKTKNYYTNLINEERVKNNNAYFSNAQYNYYAFSMPKVEFTISYLDGREIKVEDEYAFKDALNEPQYVKHITEYMYISYKDNNIGEETEHSMHAYLSFEDNLVIFKTSDKNMTDPAYNMNSYLRGLLESGEDRYTGIVKNRLLIKNIIGLAVGSILTLILFILLLVFRSQVSDMFGFLFSNGLVLSLLGWLIAFTFGSLVIAPIVSNLYSDIEHDTSMVYYNSSMKDTYKNNYQRANEILIGKNYNNLEKRNSIKKLYDISKKILLVRLIISLIIIVALSI